ncbi:MAG: MarR family transcriptional regulator [Cyclobacteriaceae bacterium]|nr:MarR family transcriptional regulator [Cyclobacteriaceae bacterium]
MRIEDEIKQEKFDDEFHKALINILFTHNYLINGINQTLKEYQITRQQYNVLRILKGKHPKSTQIYHIKDRMLDKLSDASRIVDRLKKKGLVEKTESVDDKRAVDIKISKKGLYLLQKLDAPAKQFNEMLRSLTKEEARQLNQLLDKIRK